MEKIQKIVRYIWILFNCVMLASCSTLRFGSKKGTQEQTRKAIQTNNRQKLITAPKPSPYSIERHITLAKSIGDFKTDEWRSDQQSVKNAEVSIEELSRAYDSFLKHVHYNIKQGIKHKDSEKVLSGLNALSWWSSPAEGQPGAFDLKTLLGGLLDNHLEKFRSGNVDELAYRQLEEDYNQFLETGKEYFIALGEKDKGTKLNQLVMHRSQTAALATSVVLVIAAAVAVSVVFMGLRGLYDDYLMNNIIRYDNFISALCQSDSVNYQSLRYTIINGRSYDSLRVFCEESQEGRDLFKEIYAERNPGYWAAFCNVRLFPDLCPSRQWFCEAIKHAKSCFDKKGMDW